MGVVILIISYENPAEIKWAEVFKIVLSWSYKAE